ncbi:MAG: extracellular solute-binding protein [Spongiibacteraceae bacterium]|jgi:microcin C transport system substrate-binding protein|nr:extracellular solute-binding protein [Spongiibacteraceae bacterium]
MSDARLRLNWLASVLLWALLPAAMAAETPLPETEQAAAVTGDVAAPALPEGLEWQTNLTDPIYGDPNARRGGRFRTYVTSFPLTLRLVGPDANSGFASFLRANNLGLINFHPDTLNPIPELATHWAFGPDRKSVYFRLDPDARWSDGTPVTADDYLFTMEFMQSRYILEPWYNNYYSEIVTHVVKYDDYTISVHAADAKPEDELLATVGISPTPRHFHRLDENWVKEYNWKIEPNTGPYIIGDLRKGKWVEFVRKQDWWGNDKRYFRHRFNPDYVRVKVIRDANMAYNYFRKGELDTFSLIMPRFWHRKAQGREYDAGYIGRIKFYNDVPQPKQGLYLNEDDPLLANRDVRYGIAHSLNIDRVIERVLRGDYERMHTMHEGYGDYTNNTIRARAFDLQRADHYFTQAGFDRRGADGIRRNAAGERLAVRITYYSDEHTARLVVLKEEARRAGLELTLQLLDPSAAFKQIMEKKHQAAWMAWSGGGLSPRYWEFFHSVNAHKPSTNNITNTDDPRMDDLIMRYQQATEKEERIRLAHELEALVHEIGSVIPTYKVPYAREGFWRWVRLPEQHATRTSGTVFSPFGVSGGLFWLDEEHKAEVERARLLRQSYEPLLIIDERWREPQP